MKNIIPEHKILDTTALSFFVVDSKQTSEYNNAMNYFIKGLLSGNRTYWTVLGFAGAWAVAIIDIFSSAIGSKGILNGKWFYATLIITIATLIGYAAFMYLKELKNNRKSRDVSEFASYFEPKRREEIQKILEKNPGFVTHCYECIHFDSKLGDCAKKISTNVSYQYVKEIEIDNRRYCLHWEENRSPERF